MAAARDYDKEIIWQAAEFKYQYKDVSWYWLTIIAAGILFLVSLWQENFLFAIFIVIAEATLLFWAKEMPKVIQFKLDKKGIQLGKIKSYQYEDLKGFHIREKEEGASELIFKTRNKLHPYLKILVVNKDIPDIKEFLKKRLEEIEYEESLSDGLAEKIGF